MNWQDTVAIAIEEINNKKERVAYVKPLFGVINIFDIKDDLLGCSVIGKRAVEAMPEFYVQCCTYNRYNNGLWAFQIIVQRVPYMSDEEFYNKLNELKGLI